MLKGTSSAVRFLTAALILLVAGAAAAVGSGERPGMRPPNVLVIVSDDQGWRDVGYHGSEILTPNLDRLAAEGVRLERHYVFPTCSPTRAALLTGRNPSRFHVLGPIGGRSRQAVPPETMTLADLLKSRGYRTAITGKWHLGLRPEVGPRQYGFDHTYGYLHGQIDQFTHRYKNGDRTWHRNDRFIEEEGHATDLIASEGIRFIQENAGRPFFLYVPFSVPHYPIQEEERWTSLYDGKIADPSRKLYAASVTHMDHAIGRLIEALERAGQRDNTLVIFTSDNGGQERYASDTDYDGKHGPYAVLGDNRPLRGWKEDLYEGGIRVPALASWPGKLPARAVETPVSVLDWMPTLARLAGAETPSELRLEGSNLWPVLSGTIPGRPRTLYWKTRRQSALRDGDWKLIVREGRSGASDRTELFNLAEDPHEEREIASEHPERVRALRALLEQERKLDPPSPAR